MLRIPLPLFYVAADNDENWKIVDGLQRVSALRNFLLDKKFTLSGLEFLLDLYVLDHEGMALSFASDEYWETDFIEFNECDSSIESSFTLQEWGVIYNAFKKASPYDFLVTPPLIKSWGNLPIFYIRDKNHSCFTIRIFFIKQGDTVHVGEIYHKNETNTLKEERAADSSYKMFCELGLL